MSDEAYAKTLIKGVSILECLFEEGFQGKTDIEVSAQTGIPLSTVWRLLQTWKAAGWVVESPVAGQKAVRWMVSDKLGRISASYRRYALAQVHAIQTEYKRITGEELINA